MTTRIKGKALVFKLETVDYSADITDIVLESEEADSGVVTFGDAAAGGATDWFFRGTAVAGTDTGFWKYLWSDSGTVNVAYVYAPNGNTTPTTDKPHYTGTVSLGRKPSIGGAADEEWTFDFEIKCDQTPTEVTA